MLGGKQAPGVGPFLDRQFIDRRNRPKQQGHITMRRRTIAMQGDSSRARRASISSAAEQAKAPDCFALVPTRASFATMLFKEEGSKARHPGGTIQTTCSRTDSRPARECSAARRDCLDNRIQQENPAWPARWMTIGVMARQHPKSARSLPPHRVRPLRQRTPETPSHRADV